MIDSLVRVLVQAGLAACLTILLLRFGREKENDKDHLAFNFWFTFSFVYFALGLFRAYWRQS